ncbi:MAG: type II toxin-antitoxin system RelE/ParE family toxin [Hormoscilla sp. GM7CHS1pb]|nr:type II toxin-antitoxin system RelE/ParE family toxin [Hormoscilla sp. GM7CHS1pb]
MKRYTVYITPETFSEIKNLPGNIRQRVRQEIIKLAENPRPSCSKMLNVPNFENELWRLRLDSWRILYAIAEVDMVVDVVAVRKRPPYDYGDLERLINNLR